MRESEGEREGEGGRDPSESSLSPARIRSFPGRTRERGTHPSHPLLPEARRAAAAEGAAAGGGGAGGPSPWGGEREEKNRRGGERGRERERERGGGCSRAQPRGEEMWGGRDSDATGIMQGWVRMGLGWDSDGTRMRLGCDSDSQAGFGAARATGMSGEAKRERQDSDKR